MTGGEARALTAPQYVVKGATQYDQDWIDETIEAGVAGLGWKRPKPRPASFDAKPTTTTVVPAPPAPKRTWRELFRRPTS